MRTQDVTVVTPDRSGREATLLRCACGSIRFIIFEAPSYVRCAECGVTSYVNLAQRW